MKSSSKQKHDIFLSHRDAAQPLDQLVINCTHTQDQFALWAIRPSRHLTLKYHYFLLDIESISTLTWCEKQTPELKHGLTLNPACAYFPTQSTSPALELSTLWYTMLSESQPSNETSLNRSECWLHDKIPCNEIKTNLGHYCATKSPGLFSPVVPDG